MIDVYMLDSELHAFTHKKLVHSRQISHKNAKKSDAAVNKKFALVSKFSAINVFVIDVL